MDNIEDVRAKVASLYPTKGWKNRVKHMSDSQVMAIAFERTNRPKAPIICGLRTNLSVCDESATVDLNQTQLKETIDTFMIYQEKMDKLKRQFDTREITPAEFCKQSSELYAKLVDGSIR
jgi:hypothetical protein